MENQDTVIPAEYVEFCKKVAALATEANLDMVTVKLRPGFYGPRWGSDINMTWTAGRHGDSAHKLYISSEVSVHTTVA